MSVFAYVQLTYQPMVIYHREEKQLKWSKNVEIEVNL